MYYLILFISLFSFTQSSNDRLCGSDISHLWLDIVVLVDNSQGMTNQGITEVAANIATTFGTVPIGNQDPRTTRIGIVTYNGEANVVADLNQFHSINDFYETLFTSLNFVSDSDESYIVRGLEEAERVLKDGRQNGKRANYKSLVVVYASSFDGSDEMDPIPVANRLKRSDVSLATVGVAFNGDQSVYEGLSKIASKGFNFTSEDAHQVEKMQKAALSVNCFCPNVWAQYSLEENDYGVCLRTATLSSSWTVAKLACQNMARGGYLATEFNYQKHLFLQDLMRNSSTTPLSYHIGLGLTNGGWFWQQPTGHPLIKLNNYTAWNPSYPRASSTYSGVLVTPFNNSFSSFGWENINSHNQPEYYICEVFTCDTDNYCP